MKTVKHWLHILLTILTGGLWLPIYVILLATTAMFNRGYREGKAAGRVARQNEIDEEPKFEWVTPVDARTVNCRCVAKPIVDFSEPQVGMDGKIHGYAPAERLTPQKVTKFARFFELVDRERAGWSLDKYEQVEYAELRAELIQ